MNDGLKKLKEQISNLEKQLTAASNTNVRLEESVTEHKNVYALKEKDFNDLALYYHIVNLMYYQLYKFAKYGQFP